MNAIIVPRQPRINAINYHLEHLRDAIQDLGGDEDDFALIAELEEELTALEGGAA